MISSDDIERVRAATDVVALISETVQLRQRGSDFWGCCPFHAEKSPSFHVNPSTGLWYCFGCHEGGDMFGYIQRREKIEFSEAVHYLADRAHIDIVDTKQQAGQQGPKRSRLIDALDAAQEAYAKRLMRGLSDGAKEARAYFSSRGFNGDICSRWKLGYADGSAPISAELLRAGFSQKELIAADIANVKNGRLRDQFFNRVMFPIHDEQGRCIGFGGRVMGDAKPKYLNTRETPAFHKSKHMFAFDRAKESIAAKGYAIVTEGYMDVISMHEAGFTNTVAALGTALSLDHVKLLSRFAKTIVCMFDGDAAGQHAAEAAVRYIESTKAALTCVVLPDNQDPDEFLKAHGPEEMQKQIDGARPLIDFVLEKKIEGADLSSPGLRLQALADIAKILAPLKQSLFLDEYAQRVATPLGISTEVVKEKIRETPIEHVENTPVQKQSSPVQYEQPSYEEGPYGEPAQQSAPRVSLAYFSPEERTQIKAELNLLALLAKNPDAFRDYAERIADLSWVDKRYETIAWAILATPVGTTPAEAVACATKACPDAPQILSSGGFTTLSTWDVEKQAAFAVVEAEVRSLDSEIARLTAAVSSVTDEAKAKEALAKLAELRQKRNELKASRPNE